VARKGTVCRRQLTEPLPPRLHKALQARRLAVQMAKRGNVTLHVNVGITIITSATAGKEEYWFAAVTLVSRSRD